MSTHGIKLIAICCTIALSSNWQYAFSSTYLNTPVAQFKDYLNVSISRMGLVMDDSAYSVVWDVIQNIWFVGFFIGIWLSPLLNDRCGRKIGLIVSNSFNLLGAVLQFVGVWQWQPIVLFLGLFPFEVVDVPSSGRTIASIFTAVSFQANVLYLQESPPTHLRGAMSYISEISFASMTVVGMMLGTDELLGNNLPWLLAVNIPPCIVAVLSNFLIPETPKYLLVNKGDREAAEASVRFFHGPDADVAEVLKEAQMEANEEKESLTALSNILDLVRIPHLRKALILSVSALQNTVGFWAFIYNSTQFVEDMNVESGFAKWVSTAMCTAYFIGTVLGSTFVDRLGRRKILLPFSYLNVFCIVLFVGCSALVHLVLSSLLPLFSLQADALKWAAVVILILFGFTYGGGVGAISWFISSELSPIKYRSLMQSACYSINTIAVVITTFTVLPLYGAIGSYAFLILYTLPSAVALLVLTIGLPETRGREIYEIVAELKGQRNSRSSTESIISQ